MMVRDIPTEDLEGQLMQHCMAIREFVAGNPYIAVREADAIWMGEAVKELQLRRLAMSAP